MDGLISVLFKATCVSDAECYSSIQYLLKCGAGLIHLSSEFLTAGSCISFEQTGGLFLSFSFSEFLEGKLSMYSNKAELDGGASKTLCGKDKSRFHQKHWISSECLLKLTAMIMIGPKNNCTLYDLYSKTAACFLFLLF